MFVILIEVVVIINIPCTFQHISSIVVIIIVIESTFGISFLIINNVTFLISVTRVKRIRRVFRESVNVSNCISPYAC